MTTFLPHPKFRQRPLICSYALQLRENASNGVISAEHRRRRHRHRQRHCGIRTYGKNPSNGENDNNGKNDKIGMDGGNGTNEYRFLQWPQSFCNFASQSIFVAGNFAYRHKRMSCSRRKVKTENISPDAAHTHMFLVARRVSQCFMCSRFIQCICKT